MCLPSMHHTTLHHTTHTFGIAWNARNHTPSLTRRHQLQITASASHGHLTHTRAYVCMCENIHIQMHQHSNNHTTTHYYPRTTTTHHTSAYYSTETQDLHLTTHYTALHRTLLPPRRAGMTESVCTGSGIHSANLHRCTCIPHCSLTPLPSSSPCVCVSTAICSSVSTYTHGNTYTYTRELYITLHHTTLRHTTPHYTPVCCGRAYPRHCRVCVVCFSVALVWVFS